MAKTRNSKQIISFFDKSKSKKHLENCLAQNIDLTFFWISNTSTLSLDLLDSARTLMLS